MAETRAVLVGVSDYLTLDADLKGPDNDLALMVEVLALRGVAPEQMRVLGGAGIALPALVHRGQPTRAQIMAALDAVADESRAGDRVIFYFSGHGSQAPDQSGDEGGGYDEILLPADASGWKGSIGSVENAILDDELQDWAARITAKGAQVVGLIDACHSATGFRAIGGEGVSRGLAPEALGVPNDAVSVAGVDTPPLSGEFVFLYSSQSDQRSFEYELAGSGRWQGEFTLRMAQQLRQADGISWRQLLAAVSDAMVQGPARQVPAGEGPLLDSRVFGRGPASGRFMVTAGRVQAGFLEGMTEGSTLAFYAAPSGGDALAQAVIGKVAAHEVPVADLPGNARWAEVLVPAPPPPLRLAPAVAADKGDYRAWIAALGQGALGEVDLVPVLTGGAVALTGPDGVLDPEGPFSSPRIQRREGETETDAVARVLAHAGQALRLRKLLAGAAGRGLVAKEPLQVDWRLRRGATGEACGAVGPLMPFDPDAPLQACDQLWLTVTNRSGKAQDVSILYFNADFTITPVWPRNGLSNRLAVGESARAGVQISVGSGYGSEEMMVLAVPADPDSPRADLTLLASPEPMRAGPAGWFADQLDPATSRGFSAKPPDLAMMRQVIRLSPPTKEITP